MLEKINNLKNWQVALIIILIGFAVFFAGLHAPFEGDDLPQIVNNPDIHSLANFKMFFEGSTFYENSGTQNYTSLGSVGVLGGTYYRPLMVLVFALIYHFFGLHVFYFHLFLLSLFIATIFLMYLLFRYWFNTSLSLILSLILLVHPMNAQLVYGIPSTQDVLFVFFGTLSFWLLLRFTSIKGLIGVALCQFMALLSKETAILFVVMSLIYLYWQYRKRLVPFIAISVVPFLVWISLRIHAVGLNRNPSNAPIDTLNLLERLYTAPSLIVFYLTKFIFPWKLASEYYWVYRTFSFWHVLIPLLIVLCIAGLISFLAFQVHRRSLTEQYRAFLFFTTWCALGLLAHLQIIPLDFTASEPWFYFSMIGLLGMIGIIILSFQEHIKPQYFSVAAVLMICLLGIRTAAWTSAWKTQYSLSYNNIMASKEDYIAYDNLAAQLNDKDKYVQAETYAARSVAIYPTYFNLENLGTSQAGLGRYAQAEATLNRSLDYGQYYLTYENLALLSLDYDTPGQSSLLLTKAIHKLPHDPVILMSVAIHDQQVDDNTDAKKAITAAATYGQVSSVLYYDIIYNKPFSVTPFNSGKHLSIP